MMVSCVMIMIYWEKFFDKRDHGSFSSAPVLVGHIAMISLFHYLHLVGFGESSSECICYNLPTRTAHLVLFSS